MNTSMAPWCWTRPTMLALLALAAARSPCAPLVEVGQPPIEAEVQSLTPMGLNVSAGGENRSVAWYDLVSYGAPAEVARGPLWLLADGGQLVGDLVEADDASVTLYSELLGKIKLPADRIRGVIFAPPADRSLCDAWIDRVRAAPAGADRLWLANGDTLDGAVKSLGRDSLKIEAALGPVDVPRANLTAVAWEILPPAAERRIEIGLRDGSRLPVARLTADAKRLEMQIDGSDSWSAPREALVALRGASPRVTYLSDLKPSGYRHLPYLDGKWDYRTDQNVAGGQLRSGGSLAFKGLGVHSMSLVNWEVPAGAKRFAARVGIDDSTSGGGSVTFRVFLDGREAWSSGVVRGGEAPREASVELGQAKALGLVVDFADRADVLDRADWLEARLER